MKVDDWPSEFNECKDPMEIARVWLKEAGNTQLKEPAAFTLSTVNDQNEPRSRVLLCKEVRKDGFVFYTSYASPKGFELKSHPVAAMNFHWDPLARQIRVVGTCEPLDRSESENYWRCRPRESQLSQWVSKQSKHLPTRGEMEMAIEAAKKQFLNQDIPCPNDWGGYLLRPHTIELWLGRHGRFHDRFFFTMVENQWSAQRLYP